MGFRSTPSRPVFDRLAARLAAWHARRVMARFFSATEQATAEQDDLLRRLLRDGAESDFGREHHFDRIRSYQEYRTAVPISGYERFAPYIERVKAGETAALFSPRERILMFALTSGTTASAKYIPITRRVLADCRRGWNVWGLRALLDHQDCILRHIVQVTSPMRDHETPSGVPCGAITGLLAATQKRLVRRYYTSPAAVADIKDPTAKYYTIMRLAVPRDVAWLVTANPATLILLARTADEHRERLIRDIHDGSLNPDFPIPGAIRNALRPRLRPDPSCAARLEAACRCHGHLFPCHYWTLGFLAHWTGGTMGLYQSLLPRYYGNIPSRDIGLIASEGRMSIPVADGSASGVLSVTSQFFEFIPAEEYGSAQPVVLRSHEVEIGGEYFLLLTNASGLYRYDIGDCVRVTGFHGQAPLVEFLSRDAHTSSMTGEKLTEHQVVLAMQQVCGREGGGMVEFVLAPQWGETPWYRLYLEAPEMKRLPDLAEQMDSALGRVSLEYAAKRDSLRLGRVEVVPLPPGALAARDQALRARRSRTSEQFKHQYLLPRPGLDADLRGGG